MAWYKVTQKQSNGFDLLKAASEGNGTSTRTGFNLNDITLHSEATRIPDYMFYKNINVEEVSLSDITEVGSNSFYQCSYISKIDLPSCTVLKGSAFNACSTKYTAQTLPNFIINLPMCKTINDSAIREVAYAGCPCVLTLTACETLQGNSIRGASGKYFIINTLDLPAIKTINGECLNYHQFTNVNIGASCTSIASKPFNYGSITNLTIEATTPPTLNANGLGCTPTHIYVPSASVTTYKTASSWSTYASIIEAIPT